MRQATILQSTAQSLQKILKETGIYNYRYSVANQSNIYVEVAVEYKYPRVACDSGAACGPAMNVLTVYKTHQSRKLYTRHITINTCILRTVLANTTLTKTLSESGRAPSWLRPNRCTAGSAHKLQYNSPRNDGWNYNRNMIYTFHIMYLLKLYSATSSLLHGNRCSNQRNNEDQTSSYPVKEANHHHLSIIIIAIIIEIIIYLITVAQTSTQIHR